MVGGRHRCERVARLGLGVAVAWASIGCSLIVGGPGEPSCATTFSMQGSGGCLINADGELYCWGQSLVNGHGTGLDEPLPTRVSGLSNVVDVHVGEFHACAVHGAGGEVSCWGRNDRGQVGDGSRTERATPTDVAGIARAVMVRTGQHHSCAVHGAAGGVRCWGDNSFGQLGDGTLEPRLDATGDDVAGLSGVVDLAVGDGVTCAVTQSSALFCWGDNSRGQLGDGSSVTERRTPEPIDSLTAVTRVSAGCDRHVCAIAAEGAWCWGDNFWGQLGSPEPQFSNVPLPVTFAGVTRISTGAYHTCASGAGVAVATQCWGRNNRQQLGFESDETQPVPGRVDLPEDSAIVDVQAGCRQSCVRRQDGAIWCWGDNTHGELGDGTTRGRLEARPIQYVCR